MSRGRKSVEDGVKVKFMCPPKPITRVREVLGYMAEAGPGVGEIKPLIRLRVEVDNVCPSKHRAVARISKSGAIVVDIFGEVPTLSAKRRTRAKRRFNK